MHPFWSLDDLRHGLEQLEERERTGEPSYPLCCAVMYMPERNQLGNALHQFVSDGFEYLDRMTADDCVVFVPDDGTKREGFDSTFLLDVAWELDIPYASMPCGVFFLPTRERSDRLVLRFGEYIPRLHDGYPGYDPDDLDRAFAAIADAARYCAPRPADTRLAELRKAIIRNHEKAFPESPPQTQAPELRENVAAAASVMTVLLGAVKLIPGVGG